MSIQVKGMHHAGQIVPNLAEALQTFKALFGLEPSKIEELPDLATVALLPLADGTELELIELRPDSLEAQRLNAALPPYHICVEVDDVDAALKRLAEQGVELLDQVGRPGLAGPRIGFLAPSATHGVLIELCQRKL